MATTALVKASFRDGGDELTQLVSFPVEGEEYGVEVLRVREIIRMTAITMLPNSR